MSRFLLNVKSGAMNSFLAILAAINLYVLLIISSATWGTGHQGIGGPFMIMMGLLIAPAISFIFVPFIHHGFELIVQKGKNMLLIVFMLAMVLMLIFDVYTFAYYGTPWFDEFAEQFCNLILGK